MDQGLEAVICRHGVGCRACPADSLSLETAWQPGDALMEMRLGKDTVSISVEDRTEGYTGCAIAALRPPRASTRPALPSWLLRLPEREEADTAKLVLSPMPGLIVSVDVEGWAARCESGRSPALPLSHEDGKRAARGNRRAR